jgi:hypothetical protein
MSDTVIRTDLQQFLRNHPVFKEECEVVYLMVQIRKILDYNSSLDSYDILRFYCNWTLHITLSDKRTTRIILRMFNNNVDFNKSGKEIASAVKDNSSDFFKLSTLKTEMEDFFNKYGIASIIISKSWISFIRLLLKVVSMCPIVFTSDEIQKMELKEVNGNYNYKFSLENKREKPIVKLKFK